MKTVVKGLFLGLLLFSASAMAEDEDIVALTSGGGTNISWKITSSGELVISYSGKGKGKIQGYDKNVLPDGQLGPDGNEYGTGSTAPWYEYADQIKSITISDNIAEIGQRAFRGLSSAVSATIPDSVTKINDSAFGYATSLTSVTLSDNLTSIGKWAFEKTALTNITIPDGVTSVGLKAFYNCENVTTVTIGNGVSSINESAFANETSLKNIIISDSVTEIGKNAFNGATNLTDVTIGQNVKTIKENAFKDASSLTSITISDSVTSIDKHAFQGAINLTDLTIGASVVSFGLGCFDGTPIDTLTIDANGSAENYQAIANYFYERRTEYQITTINCLGGEMSECITKMAPYWDISAIAGSSIGRNSQNNASDTSGESVNNQSGEQDSTQMARQNKRIYTIKEAEAASKPNGNRVMIRYR
ncbi:MAG: leucine-rich repeat domain-containing protein [Alphaproteobacteria bacterium]|nr:leucine-rich repeat domain-containing protein [Alphaproteobacteria bacterium]